MPRTIALLLVGLLFWSGCSSPIEIMLAGQSDMNSGGNAAVVRIYELSGDGNFANTPLSTFWQDDVGALGGELVNPPRNVTVYPNEEETLQLELADETQFLGVAANLRDPDRARWRALYAVEEVGDRVTVVVYSDRIDVETEGGGRLPLLGSVQR
jgi:type VI secretion system VasD/TssJ family lipoprotein